MLQVLILGISLAYANGFYGKKGALHSLLAKKAIGGDTLWYIKRVSPPIVDLRSLPYSLITTMDNSYSTYKGMNTSISVNGSPLGVITAASTISPTMA